MTQFITARESHCGYTQGVLSLEQDDIVSLQFTSQCVGP